METTSVLDSQTVSTGLLIGPLIVGLLMAAHGAQKLFGWFGGHVMTPFYGAGITSAGRAVVFRA